jgi:hypothetical protein
MFKRIFFVAALCSLLGLAPATFAAKNETAAVAKAAEKLRELMVDPDKAKLGALVAKELTYGHSNGKIDTKTSFIDDLVTGASNFLSITITDQTIAVVGDTALIRHTLNGDMHDKGKDPSKIGLNILQVWQKQGGKWKLLARQSIRAPQ